MTDLTVIMNTYHERPEWIITAINAVLPQCDRLILSMCEGDPNYQMLDSMYRGKIDIVHLPKSKQLGKCPEQSFRQINNAMQHVTTKYVSWTSSDDIMLPDKYATELSHMDGFKVVYSNYIMCDENLNNRNEVKLPPYNYELHKKGNIVSDLAVWETALWYEFNGFDCGTFRNYSFWDFWLKIYAKYGNVFKHIDKATWLYRQDANSTHIKRRKSKQMQDEAARDRAAMLQSHGIEP